MDVFDSDQTKKIEESSKEVGEETPPQSSEAVSGRWQVGDKIENRYEIYHILGGPGKSGMGIVYICYDHEFKVPVALKTFQDKYFRERAAIDRFKWEAEAWVRLEKHYNIVQARYVDEIGGRPYIFMEYVVGDEQYGADLSGWIRRGGLKKEGRPDIPLILNFALQFCHGMIHAEGKFREMGKPFVHRDVTPRNIMVTKDRVVKVTDFGLVKAFAEMEQDIPSITVGDESHRRLSLTKSGDIFGTPPYMSPEQCRGEKDIDTRADIYSFGCVLYEMLTGRHVFDAQMPDEFINHHLNTIPRSPDAHRELDRVVLKCLEKERAKRYRDFGELEKNLSHLYYELTGEAVEPPGIIEMEASELSNKGISLANLGLHKEAIDCWQQALRLDPNFAKAHNNLGFAYTKQGRLDEAIGEFKEALKLNPNDAVAHNNLGVAYKDQGRLDEAIGESQEALRLNPNYAEAHNNLGIAYAKQWRHDEAIREFREALRLNPNLVEVHNNLGNAYNDQGRHDEAIGEYQEVLRLNPNDAEAHCNLGNAYGDLGRHDEAIGEYQEALRLDLNLAEAHYNLGLAYYERGRHDEAIGEYKEALRLNPSDAQAHYNLGAAYAEQGRLDEAIGEYGEAVRLNPSYAEAHNNLGNAYEDQGRHDEAIGEFQEALRLNPSDDKAHYNLGLVYAKRGRHDEAIGEFREALRLNPNLVEVHYNLGVAYMVQGKFREAIACFKKFIELAPPQYASYVRQAEENIRQLQQRM